MKKKKCIIHANCQGEALRDLLFLSENFESSYDVQIYTNYIHEKIPASALAECDLFLYQHLGPRWGELSSETLIAQLKKDCTQLAIPNMLFTFYWPTWSSNVDFAYPDSLLESLLEHNLSEWEILHLYLKSDISKMLELDKIIENAKKWERTKEAHTPIKYVDLMYESFRHHKIFKTFNHPGRELMIYVTEKVFELLGLEAPAKEKFINCPEPFPEFEMPIHPQVAEYWGLNFCNSETRYNVYGSLMTFKEYATLYIKCRKMGIDDFISFLRVAAKVHNSDQDKNTGS